MIAVVPAAGRGRRLGSLGAITPKPLLEVGGRPILARVLDGLADAGVDRVVVVVGHLGHLIEAALATWRPRVAVHVVEQPRARGTGDAILCARHLCGGGSFVYAWSDVIVPLAAYSVVVHGAEGSDGAIAVNLVDDPSAGAAVAIQDGRVISIVEKPLPGSVPSRWNATGIGLLPAATWSVLTDLSPSPRGEIELTDAISQLVDTGVRLAAVPIEGPVFDVGTPERLAAARRTYT